MKSLTQIRQMILQALRDMPQNEAIAGILSSGSRKLPQHLWLGLVTSSQS